MTLPIAAAGIATKFTEKAFQAREAVHSSSADAPASRPQQGHNADQPRSINFQKALADFVSKAPQGITAQTSSGASEARRSFGSFMAKPQAA